MCAPPAPHQQAPRGALHKHGLARSKACTHARLRAPLLARTRRRLLPHVGIVTILMNDYPALKYALIGMLGLLVMTNKEAS